ncbi:MAG TPA: MCP four helix bundle domain-containing protein, partial [Geothrix sp.]|nr:MCP four helix bundle domain-containing protein [Geothrix sp.]
MKVQTKLVLGFGTVILATLVLAVTALVSIASIQSTTGDLVGTRLPQTKLVSDITEAIYSSAIHIDEAIMADSLEAANAELEATDSNRKVTNENMAKLKASLASDREKTQYQAVLDQRAPYVSTRDELIKHTRSGRKAEALKQMPELKRL